MEPLFEIKERCKDMYLDENKTITCPFCQRDWLQQGKPDSWQPNQSMSVKRVAVGFVYICHRASCAEGHSGGIVSDTIDMAHFNSAPRRKEFIPKTYKGPMSLIPEDIAASILYPYGITKPIQIKQGMKYLPYESRIYFPVYNNIGATIGGQSKAISKLVKPKNISYRQSNGPWIHYPKGMKHEGPLVLVEDIISANKVVAAGKRAAAIMGTHLSKEVLDHLIATEPDIILMLDGDASALAAEMKQDYGILFRNFVVVPLSNGKDPKDLSIEELREIL